MKLSSQYKSHVTHILSEDRCFKTPEEAMQYGCAHLKHVSHKNQNNQVTWQVSYLSDVDVYKCSFYKGL